MQHLGLDRDPRQDARCSFFQVLPGENRSTESAPAVPLLSFPRRQSLRARAIQLPAPPLHAGLPARTRGFSSENLLPPSRHPAEPAVRQAAMQRPHDMRVCASLPRMRRPRRSLVLRPRTRFQDNRKSPHRWYFGHERQRGEIPLLQSALDMCRVVPPPSTIQSLWGTSARLLYRFRGRLTGCRSTLPSCPARASRPRCDDSPPVRCRKFAGQL